MFLDRPIGLLSLIDEESHFPQGTDASLVTKLIKNFPSANKRFHSTFHPRPGHEILEPTFTVRHYAGDVLYSAVGFLEKNRDSLPDRISVLLQSSSHAVVSSLFRASVSRTGSLLFERSMPADGTCPRPMETTASARSTRRKLTLGYQFKVRYSTPVAQVMDRYHRIRRCIYWVAVIQLQCAVSVLVFNWYFSVVFWALATINNGPTEDNSWLILHGVLNYNLCWFSFCMLNCVEERFSSKTRNLEKMSEVRDESWIAWAPRFLLRCCGGGNLVWFGCLIGIAGFAFGAIGQTSAQWNLFCPMYQAEYRTDSREIWQRIRVNSGVEYRFRAFGSVIFDCFQLRHAGVLETVWIRRQGFSYRPTFGEFMARFRGLFNTSCDGPMALIEKILEPYGCQSWHLGKTKVFVKYSVADDLARRIRIREAAAKRIQRCEYVGGGHLSHFCSFCLAG